MRSSNPRSARRVDTHAADPKQPLDEVLLDVHGLHAFKRDVDFFATKMPLCTWNFPPLTLKVNRQK